MPTAAKGVAKADARQHRARVRHGGFTLIEMIVFIIVVGVASAGLFSALNQHTVSSVNPIYQVRALELAQSHLDMAFGKRYDEVSPNGGVPPCNSLTGVACTGSGSLGPDAGEASETDYDDVDDYQGYSPSLPAGYAGFTLNMTVAYRGGDLGLAASAAKYVTVTVTPPVGEPVVLGGYRGNF